MTTRRSKVRLRLAIAGGVLLLMNAVAFAAFTWPRLSRVRQAESRAQDVAVQKAGLETLWSQITARRHQVDQNRQDIEILRKDHLKFRAEDLFAAQREIEKVAVSAGLRPKRSTYALERLKDTDLVRCTVNMPLDGSYFSLMNFLARIEGASRFIVVDQMALSQDEQSARMNLRLSAIFKDGGIDAEP